MFFNELELLEIRLNELDDTVDKFVIVEATRMHSNKSKPLYFQENKHLYKNFSEKIIHIIVDGYPDYEDAWTYENHQRNQIKRALGDCNPDDVIIISDADEIPRPQAILEANKVPGIKVLEQTLFYYYLNMISVKKPTWLGGSRVLYAKDFIKTASEIRYTDGTVIPNGGWHFSYLGGSEKIKGKIEAFAHQEYNKPHYKDIHRLKKAIEKGKDLYGRRKMKYRPIPLDASFPKYIMKNKDRFQPLIKELDPITRFQKLRRVFFGCK